MLEKAATLPADEVVVDLEDGVAAADKERARANLSLARARGTLAVRINKGSAADIEAASAVAHVIVVPKVESFDDVEEVLRRTHLPLEVQIESARGLVHVEEIAQAPRLEALIFGPGDFAASLGVPVLTIGDGASDAALAHVVAAARAFGLQAIDGPHARLGDDLGLVLSARRALAHGYDGKWVIHPAQIEPVNFVFTPSPAEVERAKRLLETTQGAGRSDGELVDEASRRLAEALLGRLQGPRAG